MKTNAKNMKLVCLALAMLMILGAYAAARGTVGMVGKSSPSVQPMSVVRCTIGTDRPSSTKAEVSGYAVLTDEATFIDLSAELTLPNGNIINELFSDGLHPNKQGYQRIAKALEKVIKE